MFAIRIVDSVIRIDIVSSLMFVMFCYLLLCTFLSYLNRSRREMMVGKYKVISMSFSTENKDTLFGVLRNANLVRQFWPGWHLRVYTNTDSYSEFRQKIMSSLRRRGVQIIHVDPEIQKQLPACMWRYLVADDETVDYFFIRDAQTRLLERDYVVIGEFLQSGASFHCIRDHPDQGNAALTDGLWGADRKKLAKLLNGTMTDFIFKWTKNETLSFKNGVIMTGSRPLNVAFLRHLWHWVSAHALCHDSVSCERWPGSRPFPCRRQNSDYIGCLYGAFGGKIHQNVVYGKKYCVSTNSTRTC